GLLGNRGGCLWRPLPSASNAPDAVQSKGSGQAGGAVQQSNAGRSAGGRALDQLSDTPAMPDDLPFGATPLANLAPPIEVEGLTGSAEGSGGFGRFFVPTRRGSYAPCGASFER